MGGEPLDLMVLLSSLSAFTGELGQADYCAANAFLDAFAWHRSSLGRGVTLSINWGMWREVGMAERGDMPEMARAWRARQLETAMSPAEGVEAFARIIERATLPQVAITPVEIHAAIERFESLTQEAIAQAMGSGVATNLAPMTGELRDRPELSTAFVEPCDEIERQLADLWQEILGVEPIGAHDDFFELGGHSLLITRLLSRINSTFGVELVMQSLMERTTIAGTAELVRGQMARGESIEASLAERLDQAFPTERAGVVASYLTRRIETGLGLDPGSGTAEQLQAGLAAEGIAVDLMRSVKDGLGLQLYLHEIRGAASVEAVGALVVSELDRQRELASLATDRPLGHYRTRAYREGPRRPLAPASRNPRVVFLHSSPRAGSTMLRIMLAGHPGLFCPPELALLFSDSMDEWSSFIGSDGQGFQWPARGLHSALVELTGQPPETVWKRLDEMVAERRAVADVYAELQRLAAPRVLVDKTPPYSLDPETLQRSEEIFEEPLYIHLVRHPYSVIESLLRIRADRLFATRLFEIGDDPDAIDPWVVAEHIWAICNRGICELTRQVGSGRSLLVRFEDLVADPARVMGELCELLGVGFDERVLNPYDGRKERMVSGLGDPNFLAHSAIDPGLGEVWRSIELPRRLDRSTVELAAELGYELPGEERSGGGAVPGVPDVASLSDEEVNAMLGALLADEEGPS
jgi:acyl carrier protein